MAWTYKFNCLSLSGWIPINAGSQYKGSLAIHHLLPYTFTIYCIFGVFHIPIPDPDTVWLCRGCLRQSLLSIIHSNLFIFFQRPWQSCKNLVPLVPGPYQFFRYFAKFVWFSANVWPQLVQIKSKMENIDKIHCKSWKLWKY